MSRYTPTYPNGWKDNLAGSTPITAEALNNMEDGISAAFRSDNMIAVYNQPITFTSGIGYFRDPRIHTGSAIPMVQFRAASVESLAKTSIGVTVEEGLLKIVMGNGQTVSNLPLNIIVILV